MQTQTVRDVQLKILETVKFIDTICRENGIVYFIMGGTALGAVRHGGFIPWDDDLDIFMTPSEYEKFKKAFQAYRSDRYVLQEWSTSPDYLEYAKVRMNGTTFIEKAFVDREDIHHGIYVDIMILHKVSANPVVQRLVYLQSKFVTLYALSQRNWKPKTSVQRIILTLLRFLPCRWLAKHCYRSIYRLDNSRKQPKDFFYAYWITSAKFRQGLFEKDFFMNPIDIPFEDTLLMGSQKIREYLAYRYGDYMKLPPKEAQEASVHALIYDTENDYSHYFQKRSD